jgi:hypothetical protein
MTRAVDARSDPRCDTTVEEQALEETVSCEEIAELFCNVADVLLPAIAFENRFDIVLLRQRRPRFIRSSRTILIRAYSRCAGGVINNV